MAMTLINYVGIAQWQTSAIKLGKQNSRDTGMGGNGKQEQVENNW